MDALATKTEDLPATVHRLFTGDLTQDILRAQQVALRLMVSGAPLGEILAELATAVEAIDPSDSVASILLVDTSARLWTGAGPRLPDDYNRAIDGLQAEVELGTCAHAAVTGEVVITPSIEKCPRWDLLKSLPLGLGLRAAWSQPIKARDGRVLGTFGTYFREEREPTQIERRLVETLAETAALAIEREQEEQQRRKHETLLGRALEAAEMGAWRYDLATRMVHVDERARRLYGVDADCFLHDDDGVRAVLHPDDIAPMWAAVESACDPDGDGRYQAEYRTRQADGSWRWLSVWGIAEFTTTEGQRRAVALVGASRDVTAIKEASDRQQLLLRELSHRVRNNLAVVQSIAQQTLRTKSDPTDFAEAFNGRVAALAAAHSLLTKSEWRGAQLREVVQAVLDCFGGSESDGSFKVVGEDVTLPSSAAVTVSLVLHELATNAHKYGALSTASGVVSIGWTVERSDTGPSRVNLEWRENGGPPPRPPEQKGFGSKLISVSSAQLGGSSVLDYDSSGLVCRFCFNVGSA